MRGVRIYEWENYQPYANKEQLELQRKNLTFTSLSNMAGNNITFIYSDRIEAVNAQVEGMLRNIPVENTEAVLEDEVKCLWSA